ncbi:MAG TPA: hypothetical protein VLJ20_02610 [Acetobacteraceae bacterium]|nr:hypothetical protein [Acetobacteraceae bacterium]
MSDLIVPYVIHWDGEPEPDLAGIDDPVRVPFRFLPDGDVDPWHSQGNAVLLRGRDHPRSRNVILGNGVVRLIAQRDIPNSSKTDLQTNTTEGLYGPGTDSLPIVDGPVGALLHYLEGSGTPVQLPIENIDLSDVRPSHFQAFQNILRK